MNFLLVVMLVAMGLCILMRLFISSWGWILELLMLEKIILGVELVFSDAKQFISVVKVQISSSCV
jgi:hypothetical protein